MKTAALLLFALLITSGCDDGSTENTANTNNNSNVNNTSQSNNTNNTAGTNNLNNLNNTNDLNNATAQAPVDACVNTADLAIVEGSDVDQNQITTDCTTECNASGGDRLCIDSCVVERTGLSESCSSCYGGTGECAIAWCILECYRGPSAECDECVDLNCGEEFDTCSGLITEEVSLTDEADDARV